VVGAEIGCFVVELVGAAGFAGRRNKKERTNKACKIELFA
jgi:hypothetical protein